MCLGWSRHLFSSWGMTYHLSGYRTPLGYLWRNVIHGRLASILSKKVRQSYIQLKVIDTYSGPLSKRFKWFKNLTGLSHLYLCVCCTLAYKATADLQLEEWVYYILTWIYCLIVILWKGGRPFPSLFVWYSICVKSTAIRLDIIVWVIMFT